MRNRQILHVLVCVVALLSAAVSCGDGKELLGKFEDIDRMSDIDAQKLNCISWTKFWRIEKIC